MLSSSVTQKPQKHEDLKNHKSKGLKDSIFDTNSLSRKTILAVEVCVKQETEMFPQCPCSNEQ